MAPRRPRPSEPSSDSSGASSPIGTGRSSSSTSVTRSAGRPALRVTDVLEDDLPVPIGDEAPLESLLGSEGLGRLGAMVAVDSDGVLQGVVTLAQVRQALRPAT